MCWVPHPIPNRRASPEWSDFAFVDFYRGGTPCSDALIVISSRILWDLLLRCRHQEKWFLNLTDQRTNRVTVYPSTRHGSRAGILRHSEFVHL